MFAARELDEARAGFPELHVGPLGHRDAHALLASALPARPMSACWSGSLSRRTGIRSPCWSCALVDANPARGRVWVTCAALPCPPGSRRASPGGWRGSPADARRLLLVAAADPVGDLALCGAAQRLGILESAAQTVESDGLVAFGQGWCSASARPLGGVPAAGADARSKAHRALAEATDPTIDPDRRAWHRAQAATMPDEEVAAGWNARSPCAGARVRRRRGFLERGGRADARAVLSRATRSGRAQTKFQAGALDDALDLLATVETGVLSDLELARVDLLRAQITFVATHGSAPPLLLEAARRLSPLDPALARETFS